METIYRPQVTQFDFAEVDRRLNPGEVRDENAIKLEALHGCVQLLRQFVLSAHDGTPLDDFQVVNRLITMNEILSPSGKSLREIGRQRGISGATLSKFGLLLADKAGLRAGFQKFSQRERDRQRALAVARGEYQCGAGWARDKEARARKARLAARTERCG